MHVRSFPALAFLLLVLATTPASVRAASPSPPGEQPPTGCNNCGNYVRYGYITSDLSGWQTDRGKWQVVPTISAPGTHGNVVRASLFGYDGWAVLEQSVTLPQALLGPGAAATPRRWWVEVSYRSSSSSAVAPGRPLRVRLEGEGGYVVDETVQVVDGVWRRATFTGDLADLAPANHQLTLSVALRNLFIEVDDLRFWVEDTIGLQGLCEPIPLTPIGLAVAEHLALLNENGEAPFSAQTTCNDLPGESNPSDDDWFQSNPDLRFAPSTAASEMHYQTLAEDLRRTTSTFDISSLGFDLEAGEGELDMVRTYLAPALADLNARFAGVPASHRPAVRLMFAGSGHPGPDAFAVYESLTAEITGSINVRVAVKEIGIQLSVLGWNHTKLAVRDRQWATSGGQNWEHEYVTLGEDGKPLHDLNVRLRGDAALEASNYLDLLWMRPRGGFCFGDPKLCGTEPMNPVNPRPVGDFGPANVFSFGRGAMVDLSGWERSGDALILEALRRAREVIFISQHFTTPVREYVEALSEALFGGASLYVAVSPLFTVQPTPEMQADALFSSLAAEGLATGHSLTEVRQALCTRYRFMVVASEPGDPQRTHNKFFMVDGEVFYVGSQNLYYTAIGEAPFGLDEHGFFIDGSSYADLVRAEYWDPLWQLSQGHEIKPGILCAPDLLTDPDPALLIGPPQAQVSTTVTLFNAGDIPVVYSGHADVPWLVVEGSGSIFPGEERELTLETICPTQQVVRDGTYHVSTFLGDVTFNVRNVCADYLIEPRTVRVEGLVNETASGATSVLNLGTVPLSYAVLPPPTTSLSPESGQLGVPGAQLIAVTAACPGVPGVLSIPVTIFLTMSGQTLEDQITIERVCTDPGGGSSCGDPHMVTHDRKRYDFQAAGQFVLSRGTFADGSDFEVQVQQVSNGQVAVNQAVAARIGTHRVVWEGYEVRVDGLPVYPQEGAPIALDGGGTLGRQGQALYAVWPDGASYLRARPFGWGALGVGLDVKLKAGPTVNGLEGLLGDRNGNPLDDFVLRDGTQLPSPPPFSSLYGEFAYGPGVGWVIRQAAESLFFPDDGVDPASLIDENVPSGPFDASHLPPDVYDWAEAVCLAAGITEPDALLACILDVGVTGDPTVAASALEAQQVDDSGTPEECDGLDNDGDGDIDEDSACMCSKVVFGPSTYHLCPTEVSWDAARDACVARGAHLVKIEVPIENNTLNGWIGSGWGFGAWIGLRHAGGDVWVWTDGTIASYKPWGTGQPSGPNEACVEQVAANASWNDLACQATRTFVCEE